MRALLAVLVFAAVSQARPEYSQGGYSDSYSPSTTINIGGGGGGYNYQSAGAGAAPLVTKHVYVHVAPEQPEVSRPQRVIAPGQPRKHYKIVFIKAPSPPQQAGATVQLPQQDEEKTLIYVLHKKEEAQAEISFQPAPQSTPSKPEVYFIKYKAQRGASGAPVYGPPAAAPAPAAPQSSYGAPSF